MKKKWAEQFQQVTSGDLPCQLDDQFSSLSLANDSSKKTKEALSQGWALKASKRTTRFPDKVKQYLKEKFEIGRITGHKADPMQVSIDMRCARDEEGRRLFTAGECLQTQQIRSFFSRLAAAKKANIQNSDDLNEEEIQDLECDYQAEAHESELHQLQQDVLRKVTEKHPIYFDR